MLKSCRDLVGWDGGEAAGGTAVYLKSVVKANDYEGAAVTVTLKWG